MAEEETRTGNVVCSFCGRSQDDVDKLIAGPTFYICNECIDLSCEILAEDYEPVRALSELEKAPFYRRYLANAIAKSSAITFLPPVAFLAAGFVIGLLVCRLWR
jgi:hypothetical protein